MAYGVFFAAIVCLAKNIMAAYIPLFVLYAVLAALDLKSDLEALLHFDFDSKEIKDTAGVTVDADDNDVENATNNTASESAHEVQEQVSTDDPNV